MSFLFNSINKVNETFRKAGSFNSDLGMMTGFTPIDVLSSNVERFWEDSEIEILNGGIFNYPETWLGLSSVGKTTLAIQVISAAIDRWWRRYGPVSECTFYNVEGHTGPKRWQNVTGWDDQMMQERVRFISKPWSIIEIYNDIAIMARKKIELKDQLEVESDCCDINGKPIKILPTTYVLIDSIASLRSKTDLQFDKEGNVKSEDSVAGTSNMDGMHNAKDNTLFINEVKKLCEEAKIHVSMINHCTEVQVTDRYNPPKPQLPGMKFNQRVKGGVELLYQSYAVLMLSIKERMFNEKSKVYGDAIHGLIAFMDWLKNKNGKEGVRLPMVFDSVTGYKPELTDFEILYSEGGYGIEGSPLSYKLSILPEISFTRKTLMQQCHENPILARALSFTTRLYLINKFVLNEIPPNIKNIYDEVSPEDRIDLILRYSIDYPGYEEHGWVVDQSVYDYTLNLAEVLHRKIVENRLLHDDEFVLIRDGYYLEDETISIAQKDNVFKLGETEFVATNIKDWK